MSDDISPYIVLLVAFSLVVGDSIPGVIPSSSHVGYHADRCGIDRIGAESSSHKKHSRKLGDSLVVCDRIPHNHSLIVVDTRFVSSDKNTPIRPNVAQAECVGVEWVSVRHCRFPSQLPRGDCRPLSVWRTGYV